MGLDPTFHSGDAVPHSAGDYQPRDGQGDEEKVGQHGSSGLGSRFSFGAVKEGIANAMRGVASRLTSFASKQRAHMDQNPPPKLSGAGGEVRQERKSELREAVKLTRFAESFKKIENSSEAVQSAAQRMSEKGRSILQGGKSVELSGNQVLRILKVDQLKSKMAVDLKELGVKIPGGQLRYDNMGSVMKDVLKLRQELIKQGADADPAKLEACERILQNYSELLGQAEEIFDTSLVSTFDGEVNMDNMQFAMGQLAQLETQLEAKEQTVSSFAAEHTLSDVSGSRHVTGLDIRMTHKIHKLLQEMNIGKPGGSISLKLADLKEEQRQVKKAMVQARRNGNTDEFTRLKGRLEELTRATREVHDLCNSIGVDPNNAEQVDEISEAYDAFVSDHGSPEILDRIQLTSEQRSDLEAVMKDKAQAEVLLGKELSLQDYHEIMTQGPSAESSSELGKAFKKLKKRMPQRAFAQANQNLKKFDRVIAGVKGQIEGDAKVILKELGEFHKVASKLMPHDQVRSDLSPGLLQVANNSWSVVEAVIAKVGLEAVISGKANDRLAEVQKDYDKAVESGTRDEWLKDNVPADSKAEEHKEGVKGAATEGKGKPGDAALVDEEIEAGASAASVASATIDHPGGSVVDVRGDVEGELAVRPELTTDLEAEQVHDDVVITTQGAPSTEQVRSAADGTTTRLREEDLSAEREVGRDAITQEAQDLQVRTEAAAVRRTDDLEADEVTVEARTERMGVEAHDEVEGSTAARVEQHQAEFRSFLPSDATFKASLKEQNAEFRARVSSLEESFDGTISSYQEAQASLHEYRLLYSQLGRSDLGEEEKLAISSRLSELSDHITTKMGDGERALGRFRRQMDSNTRDVVRDVQQRLGDQSSRFEASKEYTREALSSATSPEEQRAIINEQKLLLFKSHQRLRELKEFEQAQLERQELLSATLEEHLHEMMEAQRAQERYIDPDSDAARRVLEDTVARMVGSAGQQKSKGMGVLDEGEVADVSLVEEHVEGKGEGQGAGEDRGRGGSSQQGRDQDENNDGLEG